MSKLHYWQSVINDEGVPIVGASIYVYLAGTNTPIYIYRDEIANDFTNVVPQVTTDENGRFEFWIGDGTETYGYEITQKFRIRWEHPSINPGEIDFEDIFPLVFPVDETSTDAQKNKCISNLLANQWNTHIQDTAINPHPQYIKKDGSSQLTGDWDTGVYRVFSATFQARDSRGISILNTTGTGLYIDEGGSGEIHSLNIVSEFSLNGITIQASPSELNSLAGRGMGSDVLGAIVTTSNSQTITNKTLLYPKVNSSTELLATSAELNQLHGVNLADIVAGANQTLTRIDLPKINENVNTYITSTELNALHGKVIGGTAPGDITDNSSVQTLSNKKLTSVKLNDDVILTVTSSELNALHNKILVTTGDSQTLSNKVLVTPIIQEFTNATHTHENVFNGGQISHGNLLNLGNDDHQIYTKRASSETISGTWSFANPITGQTPTTGSHLTTKDFVEAKIAASVGPGTYYVSTTATDQSSGASVNSIVYLLNQIGSNKATLIFYGNTTYNIINNSITIPSNVTIAFNEGAVINVSFGKTLTINGKILSAPMQIFSGTGTVNGSPTNIPFYYPDWFGFSNIASSDTNAKALQATIDIAQNGTEIKIFPGTYNISGPININKNLTITGTSQLNTKLIEQSVANSLFVIGVETVHLRNLRLSANADITRTGTAIIVGPTYGSQNGWSIIENCLIENHGVGVDFQNAQFWTMKKCYIVNNRTFGIKVANATVYDAGGGMVDDCIFDTGYPTGIAAIYFTSGGGLRVVNSSILSYQYGIYCYFSPSGVATSDLLIRGNAIENVTVAGIILQQVSGAGFMIVNIADNEILSGGEGILYDGAIDSAIISNNIIRLYNDNHTCIKFTNGVNVIVDGNICDGGNKASTIGIQNIGGTNIQLGKNMYNRITTGQTGTFT